MTNKNNEFPLDPSLFGDAPWTQVSSQTEEDENEESEDEEEEFQGDEEEEEDTSPPETNGYHEPQSQDFSLPDASYSDLEEEFGEDATPAGFKQLFDPKGKEDLTKLTETPPKMVIPLVRARVIDAAYDTARVDSGKSLLEVFVQEFDRRMISKDRKGRVEAVELIRGLQRQVEDEEEAGL